jgi:hypothetical protein
MVEGFKQGLFKLITTVVNWSWSAPGSGVEWALGLPMSTVMSIGLYVESEKGTGVLLPFVYYRVLDCVGDYSGPLPPQWVLEIPLESLSWGMYRSSISLAVLGLSTVAPLKAVPSRQQ